MPIQFLKKTVLLGMALFSAFAGPMASASLEERMVVQVASLMSSEEDVHLSLDSVELSRHIVSLSRHYHIDPLLVLAIIKTESRFETTARSQAGAIGLMQVMPIVLRAVGPEIDVDRREDLLDPYKNLHLGIHYFTFLLEKYHYNLQRALAAYNVGPSALDQMLKENIFPLAYYRKVMRFYHHYYQKMKALPEMKLT